MALPNIEDIYSNIGFALTYIQTVEKNIAFVTTFILQSEDPLTIEKLNSIKSKERKKALGYFIGKLKSRADLAPELEGFLAEFLKHRNDFIHNQDKIEGWNLDTKEGIAIAKAFTIRLWRQAAIINEILLALMLQWQKQTGIFPSGWKNDAPLIKEINEKYGSHIDELFTKKI